MKTILLFGAGKSASVLINYLLALADDGYCKIIIVDATIKSLSNKIIDNKLVNICEADVTDITNRDGLIASADVVISLMPPALHYLIAISCLALKKHLLTASYIDDAVKKLAPAIEEAGILFLYEMGLDPGIDHMSAMQLINTIKDKGGIITAFTSHCGGLVAPESDNNPWHYKVSWNSKNIVLAGKAGAIYLENNSIKHKHYNILFNNCEQTHVEGFGNLAYYPNRDSLSYKDIYALQSTTTFIRTTLRHADFIVGWAQIVQLKLTDEIPYYNTDNITINDFIEHHLKRFDLQNVYNELITNSEMLKKQFEFLFKNDITFINKGFCSAADILQFIIEQKLMLQPGDKDMIVMQHNIYYEIPGDKLQEGFSGKFKVCSSLIVTGQNNIYTAMAKTVGLPLGIAAKMILENKIPLRGLKIPIYKEIYQPILTELKKFGIFFIETTTKL